MRPVAAIAGTSWRQVELERRPLGSTGLEISAVGLGTARLALPERERAPGDPRSEAAALRLLAAAYGSGCTHFDTADGYGFGTSEKLTGRFFRDPAHQGARCVVTTKVGWNFYNLFVQEEVKRYVDDKLGLDLDENLRPGDILSFDHGQNFSYPYLDFAVARSLERLRTASIDVLLLHVPSVRVLRSSDWDLSLQRLRRRGRCSFYGVSVRHPIEAFAALQYGTPDVLQMPVSVAISGPMRAVLAAAKRKGVGIVGREIFLQGHLFKHLLATVPRQGELPSYCSWTATIARTLTEEVLANELVDAVVVGCSTVEQIRDSFSQKGGDSVPDSLREEIKAQAKRYVSNRSPALPALSEDPLADIGRFAYARVGEGAE